jgi:ferritin-like metal-binding protein YciE
MADPTLHTLLHDGLRDVLYAERKALNVLKKQVRAVQSPDLRAAFETHRDETEGQVQRLGQVFEIMGKRAQGKTCAAMDGLIEEGEEILDEYKGSPALDAGILAAAQAIEHYEIARYGTLAAWADQLGMPEAAALLRETLAEEERTDQILSGLAEATVNAAAERPA